MTNNLRDSMMPAFEALINDLGGVLESTSPRELNLWRLETLLVKMLGLFAVQLLQILTELAHGLGYEGSRRKCLSCGGLMKFERYQQRQITTVFGQMKVKRAYYHCAACHAGYHPVDERLGLGSRSVSPRLQRLVSFLGAHLSFGVVEKALQVSHELKVNREVVRQLAEESGERALAWERQQEAGARDDLPPARRARKPKTWVIECDGKKVGWQDGSWHEVKVGVIYELADRVETHKGRHELIKRELVARRCKWQEFVPLFWTAMQRVGIQEGDQIIAIADGAEAMEEIFSFVAPEAVRIRDFYHVAQRIHAIGELRFGSETETRQQWVHAQLHKMKQSELKAVIRSIAHLKLPTEAAEARRLILNYLKNNLPATDYARYKENAWPQGSGAVEGGCKLIGARTNGCGRRWREAGCDAIVALRVAVLNDRLDLLLPEYKPPHQLAA